jgi:hypothetical protein
MEGVFLMNKKGFVQASVSALILLVMGLSILVLVSTVANSTAAKVYGQFESDIAAISDANIKASVKNSAIAGFAASEQAMEFTPTVALVIMAALIMAIFVGVLYQQVLGSSMGRGGGAL